jgi:hypothetical protein
VTQRLAWFFERNGYVRRVNMSRRKSEGSQAYKKGDEVRLTADSRKELAEIRRLLKRAGFQLARPFRKSLQYRQPVYGRPEVARFLELISRTSVAAPSARRRPTVPRRLTPPTGRRRPAKVAPRRGR